MDIVVGTNSYVTEVEATAYFAARYGFVAWTAETNKSGALVSATQILDNYGQWYGWQVSDEQALAFPRDPDANPVPQEIKDAQCEIAFLIITQGTTNQTPSDAVERMKAGSVELQFKASVTGNPLTNTLVDALLSQYGSVSGSGSARLIPVWRC